jgi:hypothetical protein
MQSLLVAHWSRHLSSTAQTSPGAHWLFHWQVASAGSWQTSSGGSLLTTQRSLDGQSRLAVHASWQVWNEQMYGEVQSEFRVHPPASAASEALLHAWPAHAAPAAAATRTAGKRRNEDRRSTEEALT